MKELIDWVLARRYAVIALAVLFAPNLSFVSAAVIALQTGYRGPFYGISDAVIAALAMVLIAFMAGGAPGMLIAGGLALGMGVFVGAGIRYLRSLALCIQAFVLILYLLVIGYSLFGSTSNELFDVWMEQMAVLLQSQGLSEEEMARLPLLQPRLIGLLAISLFVDVMTVLFLAYWWLGIARGEPRFGLEFRGFRLGYVLGAIGALICLATLVIDYALVHNLFAVAACGFLLQALAFSHGWAHAQRWHPIFLVPVYLILLPTFMLFVLVGVLGVGPQ